jgi:hypothetical protein
VLNALGYLAERVYRHNHHSLMNVGESGLRNYRARRLEA